MKRQNVRVMLASEYPESRSFLKDIIETEEHAAIIGEADNAIKAVSLAKNLRPDVAIIDCRLPHHVGLEGIALSRIGGLDAGQAICEQIPNIRVVLLNGHDGANSPEMALQSGRTPFFCRESNEACVSFKIAELAEKATADDALIFARIGTSEAPVAPKSLLNRFSDAAIFGGIIGFFGGWILIISLWLLPAGLFLVGVGVASILLGLAGKLAAKMVKPRLG